MPVIGIDDPGDPRVADYRDIRERDLVGRARLFVAEGKVVLRVLLGQASRFRPVSVLVAEKRLPGLAGLLRAVPTDVPVYAVSQKVMDGIAGFPIHRGILATARRTEVEEAGALLARVPARALVLVLLGIANHDNMGGLFRNAAAFGVHAVLVDAGSCDPLYRKAIRVSVGGVLVVPFARLSRGADPLAIVEENGFTALALSPTGIADLRAVEPPPRAALVLGAEGRGLPRTILDRCRTVRIPMSGSFDSLNVATASGIALHHVASAAVKPGGEA